MQTHTCNHSKWSNPLKSKILGKKKWIRSHDLMIQALVNSVALNWRKQSPVSRSILSKYLFLDSNLCLVLIFFKILLSFFPFVNQVIVYIFPHRYTTLCREGILLDTRSLQTLKELVKLSKEKQLAFRNCTLSEWQKCQRAHHFWQKSF